MNKIVEILFGSHLYGTETENSDIDLKGIYLPSAKEICLSSYKKTIMTCRPKKTYERNNKDDIDIEIFSLDRYIQLLTEGQTVALDVLFAPMHMWKDKTKDSVMLRFLYHNRDKLLTKNVNAFVGYAKQQAARYGIKGSRMDALVVTKDFLDGKNPLAKLSNYHLVLIDFVEEYKKLLSLEKTPLIEIVMLKGPKGLIDSPHLRVNGRSIPLHATVKYAKEIVDKMLDGYGLRAHKAHLAGGVDWKALSHAVRVNEEAKELLSTNFITFPRPEAPILLQIKKGELPYEKVAEMIEEGLAELYKVSENSTLREKPDQEWVDDLIYHIYSDIVKKGD